MTQQSTTPKKALCLTTDDNYRTAIITLCQTCYNKAKTRAEFTTCMETLTQITTTISDYPTVDQTFIQGATLALLTTKRWEQ